MGQCVSSWKEATFHFVDVLKKIWYGVHTTKRWMSLEYKAVSVQNKNQTSNLNNGLDTDCH